MLARREHVQPQRIWWTVSDTSSGEGSRGERTGSWHVALTARLFHGRTAIRPAQPVPRPVSPRELARSTAVRTATTIWVDRYRHRVAAAATVGAISDRP